VALKLSLPGVTLMTTEQIAVAYVVYSALCAGAGGFLASIKNRNIGQWILISFLLVVIGILIVAALPEQESAAGQAERADHGSKVQCKQCGKHWHPSALKDGICNVCHRHRLNLKLKGGGISDR
jgi:hypothetical protein